jgi:hypothetical protein
MLTLLTMEHHTIMLYGLEEVPAPGYISQGLGSIMKVSTRLCVC